MHKLLNRAIAGLVGVTFGLAASSIAAAAGPGTFHRGGFHAFHGGFRGFDRGLYPYSLFGYPGYRYYGGYFPYSIYEDDGPDCRFEFPRRTVKHKAVQRGIWTCS